MVQCEAVVATDRARRYLDQLCGHLGHLQHLARHQGMPAVVQVEQAPSSAVVRFADGLWRLEATASALVLQVEGEDEAARERLRDAITARVEKIGRRDGLTVAWH
jgi:hypothetical protein